MKIERVRREKDERMGKNAKKRCTDAQPKKRTERQKKGCKSNHEVRNTQTVDNNEEKKN